MNSLNNRGITSGTGIQVLCAAAVLSLAASATTHSTALDSSLSPWASYLPPTSLPDLSDPLLNATRTPAPTVIRSTGAIEADLDTFRALLGGANNGSTVGQQPTGRREVNWDGVPANLTNVPTFPVDFFNTNVKRGLVYEPTSALEVSNQSFLDVNPEYEGEFVPFSGTKTFSPIGSNATDAVFFVAGSTTKAAVRGIGIVFVDVDTIGATAIELLGENGLKLGRFTVPIRSDRRGASFLGVVFRDPLITHVHVITGTGRLAANEIDISNGGLSDLVVMDDFIYGEPTAIAP